MRIPGRLATADDSGVTLVEIMIALVIATGVLLSLALATIAGVRGTLLARQNQLAGDMVNQAIERVRALDFADVAMVTGDPTLSSDPRISGTSFDPGTGIAENLVFASVGTLNPHVTTETRNSTEFTISRYVTQPAGLSTGTRRLTVVVSWTSADGVRERTASTFVTATRRGLPLPRFLLQFSSASAQSRGAGTTVAYGLRLKNYGARDAWTIQGPAGTWDYVIDADRDGVLDASETTALTDTNADGVLDTGFVATDQELFLLASTEVPNSVGSSYAYSWTFESIAQPDAGTASQTLNGSLTVTGAPTPLPTPTPTGTETPTPDQDPWPVPNASCATTCTLPLAYLHELPLGSHANDGTNVSSFDTNSTLQTAANDYSVGKPGTEGRYLQRGGVLSSETNRDRVADWRMQATSKLNIKAGQAVAYLYVQCLSGSDPATLDVAIGDGTSTALSSFTSRGTGTATLTVCDSTFRPLAIPVTLASGFSVNKNRYLVLRATVPGVSFSDVRIGYDWADAPSTVVIPQ
jgi:type II secretory pathway pseudopilin PulG